MCAIFGLIDYNHTFTSKQREALLGILSEECEERGTDAVGYAFNGGGKLTIFKRAVAAHKLRLRLHKDADVIMGHTRMATQGSKYDNRNNHPFPGVADGLKFALAHNGVLHNDILLRKQRKLPDTPIKTDSYIAVQLLEQHNTLDMKAVAEMAECIEGSFVFTILDESNNMYFVKGENPLALYHYEDYGFYVYASTDAILRRALEKAGILNYKHSQICTECGDILKIDSKGTVHRGTFDTSNILYSYNYMYHNWYSPSRPTLSESQSIKQLKELAGSFGISGNDIDLLLSYGYFAEDIEEMLYYPHELEMALYEILNDCAYDVCEEI